MGTATLSTQAQVSVVLLVRSKRKQRKYMSGLHFNRIENVFPCVQKVL